MPAPSLKHLPDDISVKESHQFWRKVRLTPGCWLWEGAATANGYGECGFRYEIWLAHRYAYAFSVGPIPDGLTLDHLCFVRLCVNPDHLRPMTFADNMARRFLSPPPHCPQGHPYDAQNTRRDKNGRKCRRCKSIYDYHYRRRPRVGRLTHDDA